MKQEFTSAKTSLNQLPALFKKIKWQAGIMNFDLGGGKYNKTTDFLKSVGVENLVYDPFNRSVEENLYALNRLGMYDTVTCSNVLNVIKEVDVRHNVICQAGRVLKKNGLALFTVYEGDKSGVGKPSNKGWQNNKLLKEYVDEVKEVFTEVCVFKNTIVAGTPKGLKAFWNYGDGEEILL